MKKLIGLFALFFFLTSAFASDEKAERIQIGLLPGGNPEATQKQSYILAEKLQAKIGKPVQVFISKNYSGLIEALKSKKVDFAAFSALTYVIAEEETPVKVLLKKTWEGPFYYSSLVVLKKSKIKSIRDLKNKKIVFVDQNSTSGYLYPQVFLKKNNISNEYFKSIVFSGNHAASIAALEKGEVDVAAVFSDDEKAKIGAWTRFSKKPELFRPIWTSEPIPNDPLVVRQQFYDENPKLTLEVMYDLIEMNNEFNPLVFEILGKGSLMPASSKQYDPVREMYKLFKADLKL